MIMIYLWGYDYLGMNVILSKSACFWIVDVINVLSDQ